MSRREGRDSDSRRYRSRFDREPSTNRSRRDGKPEPERVPRDTNLDTRDQTDQGQKRRSHHQDELPFEAPPKADSKIEKGPVSKEPDGKANGQHEGPKHSTDTTEVPRPRSFFQHDERGNTAQIGRSSGRTSTGERKWWRDSRVQHNETTDNKTVTNDTRKRDVRAKEDEKGNWRRNRFFETDADAPPARKRPAFREKKIQLDSENSNKAATETVKLSHPADISGRREERGRHWDRSEKPFAGDRPPSRRETPQTGFHSRERYGGADGNYKRGDRFGGRQGYRAGGTEADKWKHDLYQEANRSPTPRNEEDQIAKVEALLSS